jgi:hypothetical protein
MPIYFHIVVAISLNLLFKTMEAVQTHPNLSNSCILSNTYRTYKKSPVEIRTPNTVKPDWPQHDCPAAYYRPAVFFRHLSLTALSLPQ